MITKSKANIEAMKKLFALRAQIKELQTQERIIKENIMASMCKSVMEGGGYVALIKEATTSSIDRKSLVTDMGQEFVEKYTKVTAYKKLEVKESA